VTFNVAVALGLASVVMLFSVLPINYVETTGVYDGNMEQNVAVFTIIAVAIGGFGILMAIYTRETMALKKKG